MEKKTEQVGISLYRLCVLVMLGLILVSPFLWMAIDGSNVAVTIVASFQSTSSETGEQRMLLGYSRDGSLQAYNGETPEKQCRAPEKGKDALPSLEFIHEWVSEDEDIERESVTLLTHLSVDRLTMLENQCMTWTGEPLIAVVYVPLVRSKQRDAKPAVYESSSTLAEITRGISSFHSNMERQGSGSCKLHIELVGQYIKDEKKHPYPINALRNRAMKLAKTELVLVLDVDFVASPLLGLPQPGYKDPKVFDQMLSIANNKKALVVPAFELTNRHVEPILGQNYARNLVLDGKTAVVKSWQAGAVDYFNAHDAPWGHGPTNTSRWARLTKPVMYKIDYEPRYEPFVLLSRKLAPYADERFVGYGGNKIAYINQLVGLNFGFRVHPYAFSIHVPHHRTKAADRFVAHKKNGHSEIEQLRVEIEKSIENGEYVPVIAGCTSDQEKRPTSSSNKQFK